MEQRAIIIGASHAGSQLAFSLRQEGWVGSIQLIGDEAYYPYHHPPLSKDFLSGNKRPGQILIRPQALYEKNQIELLLKTEVTVIDPAGQSISIISNGQEQTLSYDKLAICTGARVRELALPGMDLAGIHYLRNLDDVEKIRAGLPHRGKGAIVGGGYIGLETAAMLNKMGHKITVLEVAPQLLGRVAAKEIGDFYQALHQYHGVDIQTEVQIKQFIGDNHVKKIELGEDQSLDVDFVIVGIGVLPNQELADSAKLKTNNGILVNEFAQTSDPNIVAAGDCTRFQHPIYGDVRLESVPNATEQAKIAAATICGKEKPHRGLPWFWSDQYDCKLQIAGISQGFDEIIVRGSQDIADEKPPSFCVFYFRDKKLIAADCINRPREFMLTKMWLQKRHTPTIEKLANDVYPLSRED